MGSDRRRILIFTPSLPYPPIWGFGTRVYNFIRRFRQQHDVSLLTYLSPGDEEKVPPLQALCQVHTVARSGVTERDKRMAQLSSIFSPASYQRRSLWSTDMQTALSHLMARERFDVIQVESSQLAGFDFGDNATVVLDEHNIEYDLLYRMYKNERSPFRRMYNWLEFTKFKREEIRSWHHVSGCVTTSALDQAVIDRMAPGRPTAVVANGVDSEYFRASGEPTDPAAIVMTGLMHYRPNTDGAFYFIEQVLPLVLAARPDAVFYAVGGGPPPSLKRLAGPNVVVTDVVPDVRPYVNRAAVLAVPLRVGGGTRLKVLEGLSMEKAMVSTSLGCEGIDLRHGEHLLVADDARAFADAVLSLMDNLPLARALGAQGRALIERQYTWATIVDQLEAFHTRVLERVPGPRDGR